MKIKKIYNGVVPNGKILNSKNTSQNDTYSCNYINDKSDELEENINSLNNTIKQTPVYNTMDQLSIESGNSISFAIPLGGFARSGLANIAIRGNDVDRILLYFLYYGNMYSMSANSLVDYAYNDRSRGIAVAFSKGETSPIITITNNSGVGVNVIVRTLLFKPNE